MATHQDPQEIVHRYLQTCWQKGETSELPELVAEDVVDHTAPSEFPPGREGVKRFIQAVHRAFPDMTYHIRDTLVRGEEVVVRWEAEGTHEGTFLGIPSTGNHGTAEGTDIFRVHDGRIQEKWTHWDALDVFADLGLELPRPEA